MKSEYIQIIIIGDGAGYYTSKRVRDYLKTSKIEYKPLPRYCPNLNLIERLWRLLKKNVLYNQHYDTYDDFKGATLKFLKNKSKKHRGLLESLMTENFQILKLV